MTSGEMIFEGLIMPSHRGNSYKRMRRVERLALEVGAKVFYGMNCQNVSVEIGQGMYDAKGMREAEAVLRWLKRGWLQSAVAATRADVL